MVIGRLEGQVQVQVLVMCSIVLYPVLHHCMCRTLCRTTVVPMLYLTLHCYHMEGFMGCHHGYCVVPYCNMPYHTYASLSPLKRAALSGKYGNMLCPTLYLGMEYS